LKSISTRHTLRAIATFEAIKGVVVFALMIGLLDLVHHNVRCLAIELIGRFGLNPGARYPSMLLRYADSLTGANIRVLMLVAAIYITVRLLEAYGLWNERTWGEWLGAISSGLYVPFEIRHLLRRPSIAGAAVLAFNLFLVSFLVAQLWIAHKKRTH